MKKISFSAHILPHIIALAVFLLVTIFFFSPVFFESKGLNQHDIEEFRGSAKSIQDYRAETGEEALWADAMFSGMPAYLVSVEWGNAPITFLKKVLSLSLPHPVSNVFLAFLCYYIMLLTFGIRPFLAIAGAIAFGLSSYMIIGLAAGHNGRIGAIAFMPLVIAGVHLAFTRQRLLGAATTAAGLALHLRENHVQITYYMLLIVAIYGIIRLIEAIKTKSVPAFSKTAGVLIVAALLGACTFFGQFWAITEYSALSTRGKSDLAGATPQQNSIAALGMSREYAFEFSNGILEPLTLLIPNIYGGSTGNFLFLDQESETYNALVRSGNQQMVNQLANYTGAYWGEQRLASPYYAGATIVFLFALGIAFADKRLVWWLSIVGFLGIVLSWGSNFAAFNYAMFDYFPGYNKFRSVTFTLIMILFAMPLLGLLGLEKVWEAGLTKESKKKLLVVLAATGGLCLFFLLFAGIFSFVRDVEAQLPPWFTDALIADRKSLLRSDAFRSLFLILVVFGLIYFEIYRRISPVVFYAILVIIVTIDLAAVDKRYFTKDNFKRKRDNTTMAMTEADQAILKDRSYYRVYNISGLVSSSGDNPFAEARTSYYHNSIGGYHGAKLRRYAEFYDSCVVKQTQDFVRIINDNSGDFSSLSGFNMLNIKYVVYGPAANNIITNPAVNGNGWFVRDVIAVNSPAEELAKTCDINSKTTAVIDNSRFKLTANNTSYDSAATIALLERTPKYQKYASKSSTGGLAVFSENYYPGWIATVDGKKTPIVRVNYILRAIEVPAGEHTLEFKFEPAPYVTGNKITTASSWIVFLMLFASIALTLRKTRQEEIAQH